MRQFAMYLVNVPLLNFAESRDAKTPKLLTGHFATLFLASRICANPKRDYSERTIDKYRERAFTRFILRSELLQHD